jgi:helix-turn-helix protein
MTQSEFELADYVVVDATALRNLKRLVDNGITNAGIIRDVQNLVNLLWQDGFLPSDSESQS